MKRRLKMFLATLLVAVTLVGVASVGGVELTPKASASVADIVTFGSYPQSRVTDEYTITRLDMLVKKYTWTNFDYYSGTGESFDGKMKVDKAIMQYMDIAYKGVKYRAVSLNRHRPRYTGEDINKEYVGHNYYGYEEGNIYYFKYEPLVWRILDSEEGLVMCDKIIDAQAFQNFIYKYGDFYYSDLDISYYASCWEVSSLREWLNDDFYNTAFNATEQSRIMTTHVVQDYDKAFSKKEYGADTDDKIFLLSKKQATNSYYGFGEKEDKVDSEKMMKGTEYARCQGLQVEDKGNSSWLLRTPYNYTRIGGGLVTVSPYGKLADWSSYASFTGVGIVPAVRLDMKSSCIQHSYIPSVISPTCISEGYTIYRCSNCSHSYTTDYVEKLPHKFGEWSVVTAPTATSEGLKIRRCKTCTLVDRMVLSKLATVTVKLADVSANYKAAGQIVPEISNPGNIGYTVEFTSSSPETVSVDNNGNYRALKTGDAKITCTVTDANGGVSSASCNVKVSYAWWQMIIRIVLFGWIWY